MFPSYSPLFTMGLLAERSPVDDAAPIYFTLHQGKRDTIELRSFLYLDLADSRCHPKRKYSTLSKSTSWTCTTYDSPRIEKPAPIPAAPTRRRTSKESLRSIPSPKPVPSATLPDLPVSPLTPPSPSPPTPSPPTASSKKRPASIVVTSPLSATFFSRRSVSLRSESVTSQDRRKSRLDALACLEGRSRAPHRIRRSTLRNNFMSFSDDDEERPVTPVPKPAPVEDASAFADVEDEDDAIVPMAVRARVVRPTRPNRKRRSTLESWFPLKSFIDLKDDDSSWNWRSFIEIGGVA